MKIAGSVFIVISFFLIGYSKRKNQLARQQIYEQLICFVRALRNNLEYNSKSLPDFFESSVMSEEYDQLLFIKSGLDSTDKESDFTERISSSFECFASSKSLSGAACEALCELFSSLGTLNSEVLSEKCCICVELLGEGLENAKSENREKKGFYETVYTLLGAAISIALV